ncbi:MAG TPA: hypothetical protein VGM01_03515 [Ktedonobacteraceae bacterium]
MSDEQQEMQFADPAWQPKVTREFEASAPTGVSNPSADTTTTAQAEEADDNYAHGYRARSAPTAGRENPSQGQQPPPFQNQQRPPFSGQQTPFQGQQQPPLLQQLQSFAKQIPVWAWWLAGILVLSSILQSAANQGGAAGAFFSLLFIGALVGIGWLLYTRRVRISLAGETQAPETHTFTVSAQPTVVLKNNAGSIRLRAGQAGQVRIITTRSGHLFSPRFDKETPISYTQNSATNTITARTGSWRPFGKNALTFEVTVPPQANLQLTTHFGTIAVQNVAGQINLRSEAGTIEATEVVLQGKSRLQANAGTIAFSGSLDPTGSYELITNLGTIDATLAANSSFDLEARTDLGTITTDPSLPQQQRNRVNGTVGNGPYPRLKVKTDLGTITVQRK